MPLSAVWGQERVRRILHHLLARGTLPQALLFTGPEGVGKRLTAVALAQAVNCAIGQSDACGSCASCQKIEHGIHPDVCLYEPIGSTLKIEQAKLLQRQLAHRPFAGRRQVAIIERAELLSLEAANALLRILEEPPGEALLILLTGQPSSLPATVLSRCHPLTFQELPDQVVADILTKKFGRPGDQAALLASCAAGRMDRALEIEATEVQTLWQEAVNLLQVAGSAEGRAELFAKTEELAKRKEGNAKLLTLLMGICHDLAVLKTQGDCNPNPAGNRPGTAHNTFVLHQETPPSLKETFGDGREGAMILHRHHLGELRQLASRWPLLSIIEVFEAVQKTCQAYQQHANSQLVLDMMGLETREALCSEGAW